MFYLITYYVMCNFTVTRKHKSQHIANGDLFEIGKTKTGMFCGQIYNL